MKIGSKSPKKQRNFVRGLALHLQKKTCSCNLSKELRKETKKRSVVPRKGDRVKVTRGDNKGKEGKIVGIEYKKSRLFVEKIVRKKADGKEKLVPIATSNVLVLELDKTDERRFAKKINVVGQAGKKEEKATEKKEKKEEKTAKIVVKKAVKKKVE